MSCDLIPSQTEYDVLQALWIKDMKINNLAYDEDEDPTAFEILMYSGNKRFFVTSRKGDLFLL